MRMIVMSLFVGLSLATPGAAAGFQTVAVPEANGVGPMDGAVWYPSDATPREIQRGRTIFMAAPDAPMTGDRLPLVVVSHGAGGSFLGHHDTAQALADAGFVVAAVNHPGDNFADSISLSPLRKMMTRPDHIRRLVDYMLADWPEHQRLDPARVGFFGFSAGGYTGVVAIGGKPDFRRLPPHCRDHADDPVCAVGAQQRASPGGAEEFRSVIAHPLAHDGRIKAAVIAAPALGFLFAPDGLRDVAVPVQLWRAADDEVLIHPFSAEAVHGALPIKPEYHVVPKAGHYAFLAPCSPALAAAIPVICRDASDFDRAAFHQMFDRAVVSFLRAQLAPR